MSFEEQMKRFYDLVLSAQLEAVREGIKADSIAINENMVKVPEKYGERPEMICGLNCYVTSCDLPDGFSFGIFQGQKSDPVHKAGGVYCNECRFYEECDTIYGKDMVCTNQGVMKVAKLPDDFCSRGERREGE